MIFFGGLPQTNLFSFIWRIRLLGQSIHSSLQCLSFKIFQNIAILFWFCDLDIALGHIVILIIFLFILQPYVAPQYCKRSQAIPQLEGQESLVGQSAALMLQCCHPANTILNYRQRGIWARFTALNVQSAHIQTRMCGHTHTQRQKMSYAAHPSSSSSSPLHIYTVTHRSAAV